MMLKIKDQIISLLSKGDKDFWDILKAIDAPIKNVCKVLQDLLDDGTLTLEANKFHLTKTLSLKEKHEQKDAIKKFHEISKLRPEIKPEFFQTPILESDVFKRVEFMRSRQDLENQKIAILGDDDLLSLAISLATAETEVLVLEIDKSLVEFINKAANEHGLNVKALEYNAAKPIPAHLKEKFDTFITDPVETLLGLKVCLSRGASLLKSNGVMYFGLTMLETPLNIWQEVERVLLDMNFAITDIMRNFSFYEPTEYDIKALRQNLSLPFLEKIEKPRKPWYRSSFIRAEAIGKPKPLIEEGIEFTKEFYFDDYQVTFYTDESST